MTVWQVVGGVGYTLGLTGEDCANGANRVWRERVAQLLRFDRHIDREGKHFEVRR